MPKGELYINGRDNAHDAFLQYGMSLSDTGIAALMTPAPNKVRAKNRSRLRHGEEIAGTLEKKDSREITIPFHITASNKEDCLSKYYDLCSLLAGGTLNIWISSVPMEVFKCKYISCTSFSIFMNGMMKFQLKVEEPNPDDRTIPQDW